MTSFTHFSAQALVETADFFENSWPDADVDLLEDVVTITLSDGAQYVINRHGVTQQIWVSSPYTGAHHFMYQNERWRHTRTSVLLEDFLQAESLIYAART